MRPGGSGWDKIMPHHGCMFKVSKDGSKLEVVARGFRAPNGMGVGPNGEITCGDNEGTWTPTCPINWIKPGGFYGVPDFAGKDPKTVPESATTRSAGCRTTTEHRQLQRRPGLDAPATPTSARSPASSCTLPTARVRSLRC